MSIEPSESEIRIAETRKFLADEALADLNIAIEKCGAGKRRYAKWVLRDSTGKEPDREYYCFDDGAGWQPKAPWTGERFLDGRFRWHVCFSFLGEPGKIYKPKTAHQLAAARNTRQKKAVETLAQDMPLLADQVRSGKVPVITKNRLRNERRAR